MSAFRSSIKNAGWLASDRFIRIVLSVLTGVVIARHYGPANFGLISLSQVLVVIMTPIITFGIPEILVRELAKDGEGEQLDLMSSAIVVRFTLAIIVIIMINAYVIFTASHNDTLIYITLIYSISILPQIFDVLESKLQVIGKFRIVSIGRTAVSVVMSGLRILVVTNSMSIMWIAYVYLLEAAAVGAVQFYSAQRNRIFIDITAFRIEPARTLLSSAFPLMLRMAAISIYMRIDQIMIERMLGAAALGVYSVASRISELWYFVPTAVMAAALPTLSRAHQEGMVAYEALLKKWLRGMVLLAFPASLTLSLGAPYIVDLLFGPSYSVAAQVLAIHAWAGVFVAVGVASGPWFINTGHMRYGLYQAVVGAIVSVGLNMLLLPMMGIVGSAVALVVSYAVSAVLMNAVFPETRPLFRLQLQAFGLK